MGKFVHPTVSTANILANLLMFYRSTVHLRMRKVVLFALFATLLTPAFAQQDPQFSMYMFNKFMLNPAFAGAQGGTNITAVGRTQWVGIDGAPNTFGVSANAPIYALRGGVGGVIMGDLIGPFRTVTVKGAYAFKLNLGQSGAAMHFGIGIGFFNKQLDGTNWRYQGQDPALKDRVVSETNVDLGAGIAFTMPNDKLFVGISADHLTEPVLSQFTTTKKTRLARSFNFIGGYKFNLNRTGTMSLTPSTYIRFTYPNVQVDFNLNFAVSPMIFGVSYRLLSDIVAIIGFNATKSLFVAYSYDYNHTALGAATSGSHEVILSYTFPSIFKIYPPDLGVRDKKTFR